MFRIKSDINVRASDEVEFLIGENMDTVQTERMDEVIQSYVKDHADEKAYI